MAMSVLCSTNRILIFAVLGCGRNGCIKRFFYSFWIGTFFFLHEGWLFLIICTLWQSVISDLQWSSFFDFVKQHGHGCRYIQLDRKVSPLMLLERKLFGIKWLCLLQLHSRALAQSWSNAQRLCSWFCDLFRYIKHVTDFTNSVAQSPNL